MYSIISILDDCRQRVYSLAMETFVTQLIDYLGFYNLFDKMKPVCGICHQSKCSLKFSTEIFKCKFTIITFVKVMNGPPLWQRKRNSCQLNRTSIYCIIYIQKNRCAIIYTSAILKSNRYTPLRSNTKISKRCR